MDSEVTTKASEIGPHPGEAFDFQWWNLGYTLGCLLEIFIKANWLPKYFQLFVNSIEKVKWKTRFEILMTIWNYLKEFRGFDDCPRSGQHPTEREAQLLYLNTVKQIVFSNLDALNEDYIANFATIKLED